MSVRQSPGEESVVALNSKRMRVADAQSDDLIDLTNESEDQQAMQTQASASDSQVAQHTESTQQPLTNQSLNNNSQLTNGTKAQQHQLHEQAQTIDIPLQQQQQPLQRQAPPPTEDKSTPSNKDKKSPQPTDDTANFQSDNAPTKDEATDGYKATPDEIVAWKIAAEQVKLELQRRKDWIVNFLKETDKWEEEHPYPDFESEDERPPRRDPLSFHMGVPKPDYTGLDEVQQKTAKKKWEAVVRKKRRDAKKRQKEYEASFSD